MDSERTYSALLRLGAPPPRSFPGSVLEQLRGWVLEPYLAVAAGLAHDGDQPHLILAYAHDDAGTAEANAELVRGQIEEVSNHRGRPWADLVAVEEIRVDATTLVARLDYHGDVVSTAYSPVQEMDTLTFQFQS